MDPQVAIEPTTRSQNGNMFRPGIASAINPGRITHFRPSRRNRSRAVTRSTAHWSGGAMTSQKDKLSEIAATPNAATMRFLSAITNCLLLKELQRRVIAITESSVNPSHPDSRLFGSGSVTLRLVNRLHLRRCGTPCGEPAGYYLVFWTTAESAGKAQFLRFGRLLR